MPAGIVNNPVFTDEYLVQHGAAPFSSVIMTPSGFLTDEAWSELAPKLVKGLRHQVILAGAEVGIDEGTCNKLLICLAFDGFKSHVKNLAELLLFRDNNIRCLCEGRDSSEINQVCCLLCMHDMHA